MNLICSECDEFIDSCDYCSTDFEEGDTIICYNGMHFCSLDCLANYLLENADYEEGIVIMKKKRDKDG